MPQSHGTRGRTPSRGRGGTRRRTGERPLGRPAPHDASTPQAALDDVGPGGPPPVPPPRLPADPPEPPAEELPAPPRRSRRRIAAKILTHNATIATAGLGVAAAVVVFVNPDAITGHRSRPPASVQGLSAGDMLERFRASDMDPMAANIVASAKERAYKEEQAELKRLRAKAKKDEAARKKLEAIRKREEERKRLARMNPSAAQNKAYGKKMNAQRGWGNCWQSLLTLWNHESGWDERATNPGSGAYGIPQALPGSKLASAGPDWRTSSPTQIAWGLGYIKARYHDPCGAWAWWSSHHWY
ncbi:hypothetical protein [Actinomadura atramentaria]|uniref:aggregation-promoting factor C-terminal-like domain-containing protein n=1 Tax=Actinomadura atramentaria TaxID=1990 RepID=UPI0003626E1A|nr:hypothetical protein [Actinomadura atramentaria]